MPQSALVSVHRLVATIAITVLLCLSFGVQQSHAAPGDPVASRNTQAQTESKQNTKCDKGTHNADGSARTYQDFALCMSYELDAAITAYNTQNYAATLDAINEAYFGWYENSLEPASMTLSGNRKVKMEGRFTRVKLLLRSNPEDSSVIEKLQTLKVAVARDAMVLDGVLPDDSPESAGSALFSTGKTAANSGSQNLVDFSTSLTLLLREGLEALLVVSAIVLYLIKSGNKQLVKNVYYGVLAAVVLSFALAWVMQAVVGGASKASEVLEGATMFLAVGMLFYVSNWMLSKSSGENWSNYIGGIVKTSVSTGAAKALVLAAFLAVIREGAELVLFYTAAFSGGNHSTLWVSLGFGAGALCLAIVFVIVRYGGVRIPVRPIFIGTSILLFLMCISFVGKGVQEFREADVIIGQTNLPWIPYEIPALGIYAQAETLLPQLFLLVASIWVFASHTAATRKYKQSLSSPTGSEKPVTNK